MSDVIQSYEAIFLRETIVIQHQLSTGACKHAGIYLINIVKPVHARKCAGVFFINIKRI